VSLTSNFKLWGFLCRSHLNICLYILYSYQNCFRSDQTVATARKKNKCLRNLHLAGVMAPTCNPIYAGGSLFGARQGKSGRPIWKTKVQSTGCGVLGFIVQFHNNIKKIVVSTTPTKDIWTVKSSFSIAVYTYVCIRKKYKFFSQYILLNRFFS
jgi:hypothetical protein